MNPVIRQRLPLWLLLIAIAVGGSLLFGAAMGCVAPELDALRAAWWFTLSAGFAWLVFIPAVARVFRVAFAESLHVSLLTMASGEAVLVLAALANLGIGATTWLPGTPLLAAEVALSNIVMAGAFAALLRRRGVRVVHSLAAWMLGLNGIGAVSFLILHRRLVAP